MAANLLDEPSTNQQLGHRKFATLHTCKYASLQKQEEILEVAETALVTWPMDFISIIAALKNITTRLVSCCSSMVPAPRGHLFPSCPQLTNKGRCHTRQLMDQGQTKRLATPCSAAQQPNSAATKVTGREIAPKVEITSNRVHMKPQIRATAAPFRSRAAGAPNPEKKNRTFVCPGGDGGEPANG